MSKKTENIEIRVSPEMKAALTEKCGCKGQSMSKYLRDLLEQDQMVVANSNLSGVPKMARLFPNPVSRISLTALPVAALAAIYFMSSNSFVQASSEARMAFAEMDTNGDGMVSKSEYEAVFTGEFENFVLPEACANDTITLEMPEITDAMFGGELADIDQNEDGYLSYAELEISIQNDRMEMFLDADVDNDGYVTFDEILAQITSMSGDVGAASFDDGLSVACEGALVEIEAQWPQTLGVDMDLEEPSEEEIARETESSARVAIDEYDLDRDGRISVREILSQ